MIFDTFLTHFEQEKIMIVGYARVSTADQSLDRQLDLLASAGVDSRSVYKEKMTGTKRHRPELDRMISELKPGDEVVITDLTRISRSTKDLLDIDVKKTTRIRSLKDTWLNTGPDNPYTHFLLIVMSGLSQLERDLVSQRTREGLRAAKARGRCGGRPSKTNNYTDTVQKLYQTGAKINEIARMTGLSRSTVNRIVKQSDS